VPPSRFLRRRRAVSPRAIHVLSPDLATMESLMIIPLRVAQKTLFETGAGFVIRHRKCHSLKVALCLPTET
jgi:hypothetical protein